MKIYVRIVWLVALAAVALISASTTSTTTARQSGDLCPEVARQALLTAETQCDGTRRNEICYGHMQLEAQPQPYIEEFNFDVAGDIVGVPDLQSLRLSQVDLNTQSWGIALMRLQASLPDNAPIDQNVTLILFGDTTLENAAPVMPQVPVTVAITRNANIRQGPSLNTYVVGSASPDTTLTATGRLADGTWLRVRHPDTGVNGWVSADLLSTSDDLSQLDVVEAGDVYYGPMQAFYFQSGPSPDLCEKTPNGMLIQTPEGVATVSFLVNEIDIQLGSTLYLRGERGVAMNIAVLEGSARVTAHSQPVTLVAGQELAVPLGDDLKPTGPPGPPYSYNLADVENVPAALLPRQIDIAPPLIPEPRPTFGPVETPPPAAENPPPPAATENPPPPADNPEPAADSSSPKPKNTQRPAKTPTEACPPDPPHWQPLQLSAVCSRDPAVHRVWRVQNANGQAVDFTWEVAGSGQSGSGTVPAANCGVPGEAFFNSNTEPDDNTMRIYVDGELQDTKASIPDKCG
jgi:outer membrane biosynthesis protein TonB